MKGLSMTKLGHIKSVCSAVLRVIAFYALMAGLWFLLTPLMVELYISTPFAVFAGCGFFLFRQIFIFRKTPGKRIVKSVC